MKKVLLGFLVVFGITSAAYAQAASFNTNLYFGMVGNASVTALQQFLTQEGLYTGPITGNFFNLTMKGVKAFQTSNDITPISGYFGPLSRAAANAILAAASTGSSSPATALSTETTTPTTVGGAVANASSTLLANMEIELNNLVTTFRNLQQRYLSNGNSSGTNGNNTNNNKRTSNTSAPASTTPISTAANSTTPSPAPIQTPKPILPTIPTTTITLPTIPTTTVVTTPSSTITMLWGAYVGDIDATPSLVASFGTLVGSSPNIIATFTDLSSGDFPSGEKTVVGNQGKTLLLFLEPQYSFDQINSGQYDSILQQYATAAATYGDPIILAPFDEFNLNENPWGYGVDGNTPAKFIQAWQHVHSFFAADTNVKFALVYNNVPEPATSDNTYAAYYPGNTYVDYVAVDGFNFNTTSASAQTFDQIFDPIMPTLESFDKPILFTSIGSLEFPGKAQWITAGLSSYIQQYPNIAGWVYFNYDDTSAGQDWRVNTDPASLAAFQSIIP